MLIKKEGCKTALHSLIMGYKVVMDLWRFFGDCLRKSSGTPFLQAVNLAREMDISRAMAICPLQDPLRFRARFIALEIAEALIDEKGDLQLEVLRSLVEELRQNRFLIGPYLENDVFLFGHLYNSLQFLAESEKAKRLLGCFATPLCHKTADRLVRDTLWPRAIKVVSTIDVKKAVLATWFTWLRQTTGSCFATAPAILIQQEQPLLLLQDLFDMLTFGSLKRIVSGREFLVPLCPSLEMSDLLRPLAHYSELALSYSPGIKAAFFAADCKVDRVRKMEGTHTPKDLIEKTLLQVLGLDRDALEAEARLSRLEMNSMLVRNSAVYYQKPSVRARKVAEWKEKVSLACTAYQALGDCALLRAWESTLASFSDVKVDVGRWNLYVSLGMNSDQTDGIGAFLYGQINWRLQKINDEMVSLQADHQHAYALARNAERQQLNQEYATAMYAVHALVEKSKHLSEEGNSLSQLFSQLMHGFDQLIPESFQEIFDPSLATDLSDMIDDSPAGFRLAFKHGRTASSQWTFIRSSAEFIDSIREFFAYAERELSAQYPKMRNLIEALSTELIQFIQTDEFLLGALARVKQNPAMQGSLAKPWEYISGGTMPGLVMTYFNRSEPFTMIERKIQTEEDLLFLLIECSQTPKKALMHSPTHAFIFRPDFFPNDALQALNEMRAFWENVEVRDETWLAEAFATCLSETEQPLFLHQWKQKNGNGTLQKFRTSLLESLSKLRSDPEAFVDAFLYESLPLIESSQALAIAVEFVGNRVLLNESLFSDQKYVTPIHFRERTKAVALSGFTSPLISIDLDEKIATRLRTIGLAAPKPILFADTNWSAGFFGLAISPSGTFDLWRFQRTAMSGTPMRQWFDLQRNGSWIVLNRPEEYTQL
jgi:hypothetical protein